MKISTKHISKKWKRGKFLNQKILQIPNQKFSAGDPHPLAKNIIYLRLCSSRKYRQIWTTITRLKNNNKAKRITRPSKRKIPSDFSKIDKKYRHKQGAHKGMLIQTLLQIPNKKFKKDDPHPIVKNVIYLRFDKVYKSPQIWGSPKQSEHMKKVKRDEYNGPKHKKILHRNRRWRANNRDKVRKTNRKTCERRFKEGYNRHAMQHVKDWRIHRGPEWSRKKAREYYRKRIKEHPELNIQNSLSSRLHEVLGSNKNQTTTKYLGCTKEYLLKHLLSQAYPRKKTGEIMTIKNRGFYGWHIDHIKPVSSFDHTDPKQVAECWHYTNLQPLWAEDNLLKSNKLDWQKAA